MMNEERPAKKIPVQYIADSLGLSRVTVWKVLNQRPGVSPVTKQRILEAVETIDQEESGNGPVNGNGERSNYPGTRKAYERSTGGSTGLYTRSHPRGNSGYISLLMSRANSSTFWMRILNEIASEVNRKKMRLSYLPIDTLHTSMSDLQSLLSTDKSQGIMIINVYDDKIIDLLSRYNMPKVFYDTTPKHSATDLNGDLVLLNGFDPIHEITKNIIKSGSQRVGFIGDKYYAKTNHMRWKGFQAAMKEYGKPVDNRLCLTGPMNADYYDEDIAKFLDSLDTIPDAFICASDFVASTTLKLLQARGYSVPGNVRLSGYDHSSDFHLENHDILTVDVHNEMLGKRMVHQMLYRTENPDADFEEITISPKITRVP